jgi:hypothetical protein
MLHLNWNSHLAAQADNELGNKNTMVYTEAWSPDKNNNKRFQTLILDVGNVLLATDQDKKIHALHSFKVSGGTPLHPTTKLMCHLGLGSSATAFLLNKQSLLNPCNLVTPTIYNLQECSNEDKVNAINTPPKNRAVTYPTQHPSLQPLG